MTRQHARLLALRRVTEAAWQAEQARIAGIAAEEAALRRRIAALESGRRDRHQDLARGPDAARLAGADPLWESWVDGRRAELVAELARLLARKDQAQRHLARAFGRKEAAGQIAQRADHARSAGPDQP